jgi:AbrB family looped-hinge helix DNA binding protein
MAETETARAGKKSRAAGTMTVRVDSKGRLTLPKEIREELGIEPGTTLFYCRREGDILQLAKAENPFDGLARHAIQERRAGRTRNVREFAREHGIAVNDE